MRRVSVASLIVAFATLVHAHKYHTFNIVNKEVAPDGFHRQAVTVNGITPGPIISATTGEDIYVKVNNRLTDRSMNLTTTIHWHGIFQPRTAYNDGPAFVTQCPIASGHSYTYKIETSQQTGTYWYHSHQTSQYVDGLRGALIIRHPRKEDDPHGQYYDIDDDSTVISLTDWHQQPSQKLLREWLSNSSRPDPVPDSNLFNGVGRYQGGPTNSPRPVINVTKGKRYRFRVINMSASLPFNFSIESHTLTVIEADGVAHHARGTNKPLNVSSFVIAAGQRYDVVVHANGDETKNYWITYHSTFFGFLSFPDNPHYNGTEAYAVLRYNKAPKAEPKGQFMPNTTNVLKESDLRSLVPFVPPKNPTIVPVNLVFTLTPGSQLYTVNGITYRPPSVPYLTQILRGGKTNQTDFPDEGVIVLPRDALIEVKIAGFATHPFHLHGHTFQVIQSADGNESYTGIDAPMRDTAITNAALINDTSPGPLTFRFRTDNPGPWFLHCHRDWHLEAGLALVFAEDPEMMRQGPKNITPPAEWDELCKIYDALDPNDH